MGRSNHGSRRQRNGAGHHNQRMGIFSISLAHAVMNRLQIDTNLCDPMWRLSQQETGMLSQDRLWVGWKLLPSIVSVACHVIVHAEQPSAFYMCNPMFPAPPRGVLVSYTVHRFDAASQPPGAGGDSIIAVFQTTSATPVPLYQRDRDFSLLVHLSFMPYDMPFQPSRKGGGMSTGPT